MRRRTNEPSQRRRIAMWLLGAWVALCGLGESLTSETAPHRGTGPSVRLMRAPLPSALGWIAHHYWFATRADGGDFERWEVWQNAHQGGSGLWQGAWGHVHRGLMPWDAGVGGGAAELITEWRGETAKQIAECIRREAPEYEHRGTYRAWPGPNSNTFVDAMLRTCSVSWSLDGTAIGKDYRGLAGVSLTSGGSGVQVESPLLGVLLGLDEGLQVHVLSLSVGVDVWPPALILPFGDGRFGFSD